MNYTDHTAVDYITRMMTVFPQVKFDIVHETSSSKLSAKIISKDNGTVHITDNTAHQVFGKIWQYMTHDQNVEILFRFRDPTLYAKEIKLTNMCHTINQALQQHPQMFESIPIVFKPDVNGYYDYEIELSLRNSKAIYQLVEIFGKEPESENHRYSGTFKKKYLPKIKDGNPIHLQYSAGTSIRVKDTSDILTEIKLLCPDVGIKRIFKLVGIDHDPDAPLDRTVNL